jgi:hypothetical protein
LEKGSPHWCPIIAVHRFVTADFKLLNSFVRSQAKVRGILLTIPFERSSLPCSLCICPARRACRRLTEPLIGASKKGSDY